MLRELRRHIAALFRYGDPEDRSQHQAAIKLQTAIIVRFSGGLANQMICYKLGVYLASLKRCAFIIDANLYEEDDGRTNRNFQLLCYGIKYDLMVCSEQTMRDIKNRNVITYVTKESLPLPKPSEQQKRGVIDFIQSHDIVYCDFWLAMCLREEMDLHAERMGTLDHLRLHDSNLDARSLECLETIKHTQNPVAIHVRRGDFAMHDGNLLLTADYYNRSISALESRLNEPTFFVFSDDMAWCRNNLRAASSLHFVDWNSERESFKDMHLASCCRHFILSNESTFSHQIVQLNVPGADRIVITSGPNDLLRNAELSGSAP
jgi:hypothetical protein